MQKQKTGNCAEVILYNVAQLSQRPCCRVR